MNEEVTDTANGTPEEGIPEQPVEEVQEETYEEASEETQGEEQQQEEAHPEDPVSQIEDRLFQRFASWQGRRDKDMMQALGSFIEQKLPGKQAEAESDGPTVYDDPDVWFEKKLNQKKQEQMQFVQKAMVSAANVVMQNPKLVPFKAELAKEIQRAAPRMSQNIPPEQAGAMVANEAISNYFINKASTPQNPLQNNKGVQAPVGGVMGKTSTVKPQSKIPKNLSPQAQKYMGYLQKQGVGKDDIEKAFN